MKNFIKMLLAVLCGMILSGALFFAVIAGLTSTSENSAPVSRSGILKIDLSKVRIDEQRNEMASIPTKRAPAITSVGILEAVNAINAAATDPKIKFIYLLSDGNASSGNALEELRSALSAFRENSGKAVVSYIESPTTGSYYISSVSDKVYMTSYLGATSMVNGVGTQMLFFGDLLKKFGVNMQLIRHGKYKSAGEMFIRNSPSEENLMQYQALVGSMWNTMAEQISKSRGITTEDLNAAVDELKLCESRDFLDCGLVDGLVSSAQLEEKLTNLYGADSYKDVKFVKFEDYVDGLSVSHKAKKKIAIIYANGEIIDGDAREQVSGDRFARIIKKVRTDSTIKAVIFRVSSPGGSVLASEKIKGEIDRLKQVKPVIASYGSYAASGGYWISNNCDKIFTDALTLTGSIGVFGMIPDFSKTAKDVAHVGVANVGSNKHSDMYSLTRPFDQAEYDYMTKSIEHIYDRFVKIVSVGRGIPEGTVDEIGQGRVWTGADAVTIHLTDEIGSLYDALCYTAAAMDDGILSNWTIEEFPKPLTAMESIMEMMGVNPAEENAIVKAVSKIKEPAIVARLPYEIDIR